MRRFTSPAAALGLALVVGTSCGRDHGGLALGDPGGGTAGAAGGSGGVSGSAGTAHGGSSAAGTSTGGSGTGGKVVEPPGRSVTSFVHGIVDADRVLFCFARHDQAEPELVGDPMPAGGLAYGASFAFEELAELDLESESVLPFVIAGELSLVDGMDCRAAVAKAEEEMTATPGSGLGAGGAGGEAGNAGASGDSGAGGAGEPPPPPRLRVARLPELPPGVLAEGYSSLYVAFGCLGGPAFTHDLETDACGSGYEPKKPTLDAALVTLSRYRVDGTIALQALHASRASDLLSLVVAPPPTASQPAVLVVQNLHPGELLPRQPSADHVAVDYGLSTRTWSVNVLRDGVAISGEHWPAILTRAGLETLEPGRGYTLVVLGPRGDIGSQGFWNAPAIGVVDNDP